MERTGDQTKRLSIAATVLFLVAGMLHLIELSLRPLQGTMLFLLGNVIYIGLAIGWAASIRQRIIAPRIRRLMVASALLAAFWLFLRACKYRFFQSDTVCLYLWYLYYLPQLIAPTLTFLTALEQHTTPEQPLSRKWYLVLIPAAMLFLGVLTNEAHHLAFRFPLGEARKLQYYTHGPLYFLAMTWIVGMLIASMIILFRKCRVESSRRYVWLPVTLFALGFVLCVLSFTNFLTAFRIPEMLCATFAFTWECCIQIGFIPSNTDYGSFFAASTISAQITDEHGVIAFDSGQPLALTAQQRNQAQHAAIFLDPDTRLHSHPVHGGRVYWTDSVAQINRIRQQLTDASELLAEDNELIRADNETRRQQAHLEEQNRLYDSMAPAVQAQLRAMDALLKNLTPDAPDFDQRIALICVYGAYVKRRCNLTLMQDAKSLLSSRELALCLRESLSYMSMLGTATSLHTLGDGMFSPNAIILAYDFFEAAVEAALPSLSVLLVNLTAEDRQLSLRLALEDAHAILDDGWEKERLSQFCGTVQVERQDGTLFAALTLREAGECL